MSYIFIHMYISTRCLPKSRICSPSDGGSAGANCWFDAGHSDSMDPMTFRRSALGGHGAGRKGGEQRWGVGGSFSWGEGFGGWRLGSG